MEFFGVKRIPSENKPGLSLDPFKIHQGANGGYQALNLAVLLGVKTVFLLGFDMRSVDGKKHWHGDHPNGLNNPTDDTYRMWINAFNTTIGDLKTAGVEVINCTHDSALRCFRFGRIEDFL